MKGIFIFISTFIAGVSFSQNQVGFGASSIMDKTETTATDYIDNTSNEATKAVESATKAVETTIDNTVDNVSSYVNRSYSNIETSSNADYRVQVFLSRQPRFPKKYLVGKDVDMISSNGYYVFNVNGFNNDTEAFNYSQDLRRRGVEGAFVTKYDNGYRDYGYSYDLTGHQYKKVETTSKKLDYPSSGPIAFD